MPDEDRLDEIKARLERIPPADPLHFPRVIGGWYVEDVPWLIEKLGRLQGELVIYRTALEVVETRAASALNAGVQMRTAADV